MFEDEYKDSELSRREYRCRVCDGPVGLPIQLVCDECDRRDTEEMEREEEFYSALLGIEEPVYRELVKEKEMVAATPGSVEKRLRTKRMSYEM